MIIEHAETIAVEPITVHGSTTDQSVVTGHTVEGFVGLEYLIRLGWTSANRGVARAVRNFWIANRCAAFSFAIPGVGSRLVEIVEAPSIDYTSPGRSTIVLVLRTTTAAD